VREAIARFVTHPLGTLAAAGATNVVITAFVLLNSVLMARLLGPAGRGTVFMVVAASTTAAALLGSFAHPVLARRAAAALDTGRRLNGLCLLATVPLAAAAAVVTMTLVLGGGLPLTAQEKQAAVLYVALWSPASLMVLAFQAADLGTARWRRYHALRMVPYPVILAGLLLCFASGWRTAAAALLVLLASTLAPMVARLWLAAREGGFDRPSAHELRAFYREGWPFMASSGGAAALANADQMVAAMVLRPAEAGLYAVAQRAGLVLGPLAMAAGVVGFSEAARAAPVPAGSQPGSGAVTAILIACAAVLAPAIWFAVPVLYGGAFAPARGPAVLALGAGLVAALAEVREQRLEGAGRPLRAVPGRIAGAAAMTLAAIPAGLRWGPWGIVAGGALGQCVRALVLGRVAGTPRP
jgi:O-antigen/teichoic acid export membrane protein